MIQHGDRVRVTTIDEEGVVTDLIHDDEGALDHVEVKFDDGERMCVSLLDVEPVAGP